MADSVRGASWRIVHLITRMDRGGSAVNTLLTVTAQARAGCRVWLLFGPSLESNMGEAERTAVVEGLDALTAAGGSWSVLSRLVRAIGMHDFLALVEIRSRLRALSPDLLHTHTSKAGVLGRIAALGLSVRVVHTPHGHIFHGYFSRPKTVLFVALERILARISDVLIALTAAERDDHLALGVGRATQWRVVPSGVDVETIAGRVARLRASMDERRWWAVSVGRLEPVKGMDRLLRAWAEVVRLRSDARLAIVGDGGERQALLSLAERLGICASVHFVGWDDPVPWLASARCFVLLSRNEGMGRSVVEAMAAGLPCVVSDVCGLVELVDESVGARVDGDDSVAVARAILAGYDCQTALRVRARRYSVAAMVEGVWRAYAMD